MRRVRHAIRLAFDWRDGMLFSAKTVYDKERLLRFNTFYVLSRRLFWIVMLVSTLLVSAAFALSMASGNSDKLIIFCFILVWVIVLLYTFLTLILPVLSIKKAKSLGAVITYTFDERSFKLEAEANGQKSMNEVSYSILEKVMESKQDIYLFLNNRQCFIVDKSGFTDGSPETLIKLLKAQNVKFK